MIFKNAEMNDFEIYNVILAIPKQTNNLAGNVYGTGRRVAGKLLKKRVLQ